MTISSTSCHSTASDRWSQLWRPYSWSRVWWTNQLSNSSYKNHYHYNQCSNSGSYLNHVTTKTHSSHLITITTTNHDGILGHTSLEQVNSFTPTTTSVTDAIRKRGQRERGRESSFNFKPRRQPASQPANLQASWPASRATARFTLQWDWSNNNEKHRH